MLQASQPPAPGIDAADDVTERLTQVDVALVDRLLGVKWERESPDSPVT